MPTSNQALQARRLLDDKFAAGTMAAIRIAPRSGWIKAVRTALGMSQGSLAKRLGISRAAVSQLEAAEREGRITVSKLSEVAAAMECTLVYALLPDDSLENVVQGRAAQVVDEQLDYVNATMALEDQSVRGNEQKRFRQEQIAGAIRRGDLWRTP